MSITFKYLFRKPVTVQYPFEKVPMYPRYRGMHFLERYEDGTERCVCCGLCAKACPADCIYMEPSETDDGVMFPRSHDDPLPFEFRAAVNIDRSGNGIFVMRTIAPIKHIVRRDVENTR